MVPTKIGFSRATATRYISENLLEEGETRETIEGLSDEELKERILDGDVLEDETEFTGFFAGAFPKDVVCFETVFNVIGGAPVSIEEYLDQLQHNEDSDAESW